MWGGPEFWGSKGAVSSFPKFDDPVVAAPSLPGGKVRMCPMHRSVGLPFARRLRESRSLFSHVRWGGGGKQKANRWGDEDPSLTLKRQKDENYQGYIWLIIKPVTELTFISFHSSALYIYIQVFVQVCAIFLLRDGERQGREGVKGENLKQTWVRARSLLLGSIS